MRNTEERTALILQRAHALRRRREKRGTGALAALCCVLCAGLTALYRAAEGGAAAHVPGLYGAALLYGGAGGYVLAGVIAFAAGVAVTVLCIRYQKKDGGKTAAFSKEPEEIHRKERNGS